MSDGKDSNSPMVAREIGMPVATGSKLCWWIAHDRRDEIFDTPWRSSHNQQCRGDRDVRLAASIAAARCYGSVLPHCGPMEALWEAFEFDHRVCGDPFFVPTLPPFFVEFLERSCCCPNMTGDQS